MTTQPYIRQATLVVLVILTATAAVSQTLDVLPVPADPNNANIPHTAYDKHPTRLKAIGRDNSGSSHFYFRWDVDGDGYWDLDAENPGGANADRWYYGPCYDLDFVVNTSDFDYNKSFIATIQVSTTPSPVNSRYGSVPFVLLDGFPDPDSDPTWAESADPWQLRIMTGIALDDALWYLHLAMVRTGGNNSSQIMGYIPGGGNPREQLTNSALFLKALLDRGHLPAYPVGYYQEYGVTPPADFASTNDMRWNTNPYAEDATRLMNYLLYNMGTTQSIAAADEGDDGTTPIPGTNDGVGWNLYPQLLEYSPCSALGLVALANTQLAGTVAQTGGLTQGKTMEFVVQQIVDYIVGAQYDENGGPQATGAWGYTPCIDCGASSQNAYGQHFGWAVYALHEAEVQMSTDGVYVNDRVKTRLPNMLYYNQFTDGGPRYKTSGSYSTYSTFEPVGHFLLACRWLGWDQWEITDPQPCPYPSLTLTHGEARQIYDDYLAFTASRWTQAGTGSLSDPNMVLWQDGDYSSGTRGHSWFISMLTTSHGLADRDQWFGSHDWATEFSVDLVYQQRGISPLTWYNFYTSNHYTNSYLAVNGHTALAAALMVKLDSDPDLTPPSAPTVFGVDYCAYQNTLTWDASSSDDVVAYNIYRGDEPLVPIEQGYWVGQTPALSWDDYDGWDWGHHYRLTAVDYSGNASDPISPTQLTDAGQQDVPLLTTLGDAYPNPFNPITHIPFALAKDQETTLSIYDLGGRLVATPLNAVCLSAGPHEVVWNGKDSAGRSVSAGVFVYRLKAEGFSAEGRVVLVK